MDWICFECAQPTDPSKAFCECTFCQVRFCFDCHHKHPQSHNNFLVTLRRSAPAGMFTSAQRCVGCERSANLRYQCQACHYAQCLECWRILGINRHEHNAFALYELRQDFSRRKPSLPLRLQSAPVMASSQSAAFASPYQRTTQNSTAQSMPSIDQPQLPRNKRYSLSRGLKKAYALSQKNTLTKVATGIALGTISVAVGADLSGIVDGMDGFGFGEDSSGVGIDPSDAATQAVEGAGDQGLGGGELPGGDQQFSGLQNGSAETTEWMQQQYWQSVQLPNLAGPTLTPAMLNPTN